MASNAPFVMKIKYYAPTKNNHGKNVAHIDYIANRPGVDKGSLEPENRDVEFGDEYVKYINNRPGSHGLFGETGEHLNITEIQEELGRHQGLVWRLVLSLREDDAIRLDYCNRQSWEKMLNSQVKTAAEKMGIERSNLRWCAAFHEAKGHPHVHLVLWEKKPQRTTGALGLNELKDVKKTFGGEIFREERLNKMMVKDSMRKLVREQAQESVSQAKDIIRAIRKVQQEGEIDLNAWFGLERSSLPPEQAEVREKELAKKIYSLSEKVPGFGRVALKFMPEDTKEQAREVADWIMGQPQFKQEVEKYLEAAGTLAKAYTTKPEQLQQARDKAYDDLRDRVAQIVLKGTVESQKLSAATLSLNEQKAARAQEVFSKADKKLIDKTPRNIIEQSAKVLKGLDGMDDNRKAELLTAGANRLDVALGQGEAQDILNNVESSSPGLRKSAAVLKVCCNSDQQAKMLLASQCKELDISTIVKTINSSMDQTISKKEFDQLCIDVGVKVTGKEHPWKPVYEVVEERRGLAISFFNSAGVINREAAGWTGFTMYAGLKMLGVGQEEREAILTGWSQRNGLKIDVERIANKLDIKDEVNPSETDELKYLQKETWERLTKNLTEDEDVLYPWKVSHFDMDNNAAIKVLEKKFKYIEVSGANSIQALIKYGRFLHACGIGKEDIQQKIYSALEMPEDADSKVMVRAYKDKEIDKSLDDVSKQLDIQEKGEFYFSDKEWDRFAGNMGIQAESPWDKVEVDKAVIIEERQKEAISLFKKVGVENWEEASWTGFTMYAGLKMLGVGQEEREAILTGWSQRNGLKIDVERIANKLDNKDEVNPNETDELKYLQKETWERLTKNLGIPDAAYPWATKENPYVLNKEKVMEAIKQVENSTSTIAASQVQWSAQKLTQLLATTKMPVNNIKETVKTWAEKSEYFVNVDKVYEDAIKVDPVENMQRMTGAKDDVQQVLNTFAKTLISLGSDAELASQIISSWNERSGSNINELKIDKAVNNALKEKSEAQTWGTQFFVGKKSWQELCERVGVEADWAWKNSYAKVSVLSTIWKSCWRAVERERQLAEAQADMQKRMSAGRQGVQKGNAARHKKQQNNLERGNEE